MFYNLHNDVKIPITMKTLTETLEVDASEFVCFQFEMTVILLEVFEVF